MSRRQVVVAALAVLAGLFPSIADAQFHEAVGVRARGMAGAFVAVADDSSAAWWNPAGLASGAFLDAQYERGRVTQPSDPVDTAPASRATTSGFAIAFPALGISYYRFRLSEIRPIAGSTGSGPGTRQEDRELGVSSMAVNQFGFSAGQSLGNHLVVATTAKLVRAGLAVSGPVPGEGLLDVGDDLEIARKTRADFDAGVMARFNTVRIGLSVRNVLEPEFTTSTGTFRLDRQARVGVANVSGRVGMFDAITLAADLDVTRTETAFGDRRRVAGGGELWMLKRRLGVRGGFNRNTLDDDGKTTLAFGASVGITSGVYVEAASAAGGDQSLQGWSGNVRMTY